MVEGLQCKDGDVGGRWVKETTSFSRGFVEAQLSTEERL